MLASLGRVKFGERDADPGLDITDVYLERPG
jgi:hypothetical protein